MKKLVVVYGSKNKEKKRYDFRTAQPWGELYGKIVKLRPLKVRIVKKSGISMHFYRPLLLLPDRFPPPG
jgi:hypothetical protein